MSRVDLYELLELDDTSTPADIRVAYRRLAKIHHPDKNDNGDRDTFQAIQGAYEILSDPNKRAAYDRSKAEQSSFEGWNTYESFFSHNFGFSEAFGDSAHPSNPLFERSQAPRSRPSRGTDQVVEITCSLEEAFVGHTKTFRIEKNMVCSRCSGSGCRPGCTARQCTTCSGKGRYAEHQSIAPGFRTTKIVVCSACGGSGEMIPTKVRCKRCKGRRTLKEATTQHVHIEKGTRTGDRIILRGEGEQEVGQQPGDLILVVRVKDHSEFTLRQNTSDLEVTVTLTLSEALTGFDRVILTHLDGSRLRSSSPSPGALGHRVYSPMDKFKVVGQGFPKRRGVELGDLHVTIQLAMPTASEVAALSCADVNFLATVLPPPRSDIFPSDPSLLIKLIPVSEA